MSNPYTTRPNVDPDGWYNTIQAIQLLGISRSTFWRKRQAGLIKGHVRKFDNRVWFRGREIIRLYDATY